jgi:YD repeat-containing protein
MLCLLTMLLLPVSFCSAFDLPVSLPKPPVPTINLPVPGLELLRKQGPWITTGIADAVTEVPFLDHYDPRVLTPLDEMPASPTGERLVLPGAYDFYSQTYCLHAGTYAPGSHGAGYLFAPLQGPGATVLTGILRNSCAHAEIPQRNVQLLIWALLARTPLDQCSPVLQQTAKTLLSSSEIRSLQPAALIPDNLVHQSFVGLPGPVQQALELEANLRNMFANKVSDYTQIEGVAVLNGDPPPSRDNRTVPAFRWSYAPNRYFVAFAPETYHETTIQYSLPAGVSVEYDARGRLLSVTNQRGDQITAEYADDLPAALSGDAGVKVSALRALHFTANNALHPGRTLGQDFQNTGYVLTGLPSGKGRPSAGAATPGLTDRYTWSVAHRREVESLLTRADKSMSRPPSAAVRAQTLARLVDLGNFAQALWEVLSAAREQDPSTDLLFANPAYEGWQALLLQYGHGRVTLTPPPGQVSFAPHRTGRLAFVSSLPAAVATMTRAMYGEDPLAPLVPDDPLAPLVPDPDDVASPSETGRQRLATSGRDAGNDSSTASGADSGVSPMTPLNPATSKPWTSADSEDDNPDADRNHPHRNGSSEGSQSSSSNHSTNDQGSNASDDSAATSSSSSSDGDQAGNDSRSTLQKILDVLFPTAGQVNRSLGGDPPRSDFDQVSTPQAFAWQPLSPETGFSEPRRLAYDAQMVALLDWWSKLRAAQITRDRLGGAYAASDKAGIRRQALALIEQKRQCGLAAMVVADRMEALAALTPWGALRTTPAEALAARQADLRAHGLSAADREAGQFLGLTDEEMQGLTEHFLDLSADRLQGNPADLTARNIARLRALGMMWATLPQAPPGG